MILRPERTTHASRVAASELYFLGKSNRWTAIPMLTTSQMRVTDPSTVPLDLSQSAIVTKVVMQILILLILGTRTQTSVLALFECAQLLECGLRQQRERQQASLAPYTILVFSHPDWQRGSVLGLRLRQHGRLRLTSILVFAFTICVRPTHS